MGAVRKQARRHGEAARGRGIDQPLLIAALCLLTVGVVMVASTSVAVAEKYDVGPWHFLVRHLFFVALG
ncbi:MAG: hypothetical protein R3323_09385, partial [Wenzhouxiangellaceae bacterium]|nr:hypothetical protein [Wenzhouxiangellaceae bacterium]